MVGLCLGPYGGPRRVGVSYERRTPAREGGRTRGNGGLEEVNAALLELGVLGPP